MKAKCILWICLVLAVITLADCRKQTTPPVSQPASQKVTTAKSAVNQAGADKSTAAQKPAAAEPASIVEASETDKQEQKGETEYYALFLDGKKIGHSVQSRLVSDGKVTTSENVIMTVSRLGISLTIEMTETCIETVDGRPAGFEVIQQLGAGKTVAKGSVDDKGNISLVTISNDTEKRSSLQWPKDAIMAEGLRLLSLKKGLAEGTEYSAKIYSPGILDALNAQIRIGSKQNVDLLGRVVALTQEITSLNMPGTGNVVSTSYVDDELNMQKSTTPIAGLLVEMVACPREFALGQNDVVELINKMFLAAPDNLKDVGSAKSITYYLSLNDKSADFVMPSGDNQKVQRLSDGQTIVTVAPVATTAGASFPYKGNDKEILAAVAPTRFLQSDNKQIIALARKAVGDAKDAAQAAQNIEAFVAGYIQNRSLSVGYASAVEVAESRQGDCTEFAVLTAALCRAVGIPAQVVAGIAYVDDFGGLRGLGGHAWTQVYINGIWVCLDSAFRSTGRGGYDAGHIAMAAGNGEPADFFNLATTLGRFKIEKVEITR
jgi:hypothetical protein